MLNKHPFNLQAQHLSGFWLGACLAGLVFSLLVLLTGDGSIISGHNWLLITILIVSSMCCLIYLGRHYFRQEKNHPLASGNDSLRKQHLAEIALHTICEGVIITDTQQIITHINPFACQLTGWSYKDAVSQPLDKVLCLHSESTHNKIKGTALKCLQSSHTIELEDPVLLMSRDGHEHAVEASTSPIEDENGIIIGTVVIFRDITRVNELSRKLKFQATHDSLTNLINRREFEHQLKLAINSADDESHSHVLCYMDLDQFKIVNDTCGHIAGDQLLRELSKLMPFSIRSSDCLARLGGDEFGVIMFDCPMEQAMNIAEDLRTAISDFIFTWDKKIFDIGVSIGLVAIGKNSGSLQDIMRRADASCYIAKDFGRNRIHIYTEDDHEHARRRGEMQWLTKIHNTLKEDRFKLAIQPVKPIDNSADCIHYEVLLRMEDEEGKLVAPTSFLPAAERYDMMPVIDRWVITTSFSNISKKTHPSITAVYNINLSGQTLRDDDILTFIREQIENHHISPQTLCFEITETAAIANLGSAIELIAELKTLGCKFALDDFGSGLSSFAYLKKLPVDYLKIDGTFVHDALNNQLDRAIVSAINTIGHEMGLKTVAEYVDTEETLSLMKQLGVNYAQGYAIEKPVTWKTH